MNHDITFCASTQCPKADTCRRAHPPSDIYPWLSFNNFYVNTQPEEACKAYWPMVTEEKK